MKKIILSGIFLTLIFTNPALLRAGQFPSSQAAIPGGKSQALPAQTYDQLVTAIRRARTASRARLEQAARQEKVREAWETGKLIDEHVLQHKERANYAQQVISRLSSDLGLSDRELYYSLRFYRLYPILPHASKLSWSEYRELLSVEDAKERQALAEKTEKEGWSRDQMREEVKARTHKEKPAETSAVEEEPVSLEEEKLTAQPGKPGTYRMVKATVGPEIGKVVIDLGFSNYYRTSKDLRFKTGDIIETLAAFPETGSSPSDKIKLSKRTSSDLYTYRAYVVRVLDGDTLKVVVDLGFGVRSVQTLRLRGIDCPELVSKEGKEAKEFVESVIASLGEAKQSNLSASDELSKTRLAVLGAQAPSILIKTSKSDKYDRYLADIFFTDSKGQPIYLNNLLLQKGYAVRVHD